MRSAKLPTPAQLGLGNRRASRSAGAMLAAVVGDPAYLHEIDTSRTWSRKQLEKAVNALIDEGSVVRYGAGTRRLYARAREIPSELDSLTSVQVRLLQYMPPTGAVTLAALEAVMSETGATVRRLTEHGLVVRIAGTRDIVALTHAATAARSTLGYGLALEPLDDGALDEAIGPRQRGMDELAEIARIRIHQPATGAAARKKTTRKEDAMRNDGPALAPELAETLTCYLLVRTDLPSLGRGKAFAHSMHAGNQLTYDLWVKPLLAGGTVDPRVVAWHAQGGGFGTTLAVGDAGQVDIMTATGLVGAARRCGHLAGLVVDPTYPYLVDDEIMHEIDRSRLTSEPRRTRGGWMLTRRETTAAWVLGHKEDLAILLARFGLVPND